MSALHRGAIIVAIASGSYALAALLAGSPLEFGVALALCGACWIAVDFIECTVERERATRGPAVLNARRYPDDGSCHLVFVGAGEYSSRPALRRERVVRCPTGQRAYTPIRMTVNPSHQRMVVGSSNRS